MKNILISALILVSSSALGKVAPDEQTWVNLNAFINVKKDFQLYLEAQPRFIDYHARHGTSLYRAAFGKELTRSFSIWLGYGFIERTNPSYLHEDRPFLQTIHGLSLRDNLKLINRTRFEARYFRGTSGEAFRLRHLLRGQYRFQNSDWGLVIYDELFWNSSSHRGSGIREGFDQNRAFAGVSYSFGKDGVHLGELGYLHQYVNGAASDASNDVLAAQITFRLP